MTSAADAKQCKGTKSGAALGGVAGALQRSDLGLVEHIRDRLATLHKKHVARKTAQQCEGTGRSVIGC